MTESEIAVIVNRLDNLKEQVESSKIEANEWRNRFMERLDNLPCGVRIEQSKGIRRELQALWVLVGSILFGIIAEYVKLK